MGQRVIPVAVTAEYIGGDGVTLGAAGSHNSVLVEYDFRSAGPQWEGVSGRYVLWTNPQGNNTNRINLGVNEMVEGYDGVYQAAPPPDAMCVPGWAEMVVVGFTLEDGKEITKVKTEPSRFRVLPGARGSADNEGVATTVADQLQAEIEGVYARLDSEKVNKPTTPYDENGTKGQILETLGDGSTRWRDEVVATEEVVDEVLHNHLDWVTTVQSGSLSEQHFSDALKKKAIKDYVTPQMFGAKGDGVTDDGGAFELLASYCDDHPGSVVFIPKGHYIINRAIVFHADVIVRGVGEESFLDFRGYVPSGDRTTLLFTGSATSLGEWMSLVEAGGKTIQVSDSDLLSPGDLITLRSTIEYSYSPARDYYRNGEFCEVANVVGTSVTLEKGLRHPYSAGKSIPYKINPIQAEISDLSIYVYDPGNSVGPRGLEVRYGKGIKIARVTARGSNHYNIGIITCFGAVVDNVTCDYYSSASVGVNYGLAVISSQQVVVKDSVLKARHHGITIGGGDESTSVINRYIKIQNCYISNRSQVLYSADCHTNAEDVTFSGCTIRQGITIGAKNAIIESCTIDSLDLDGVAVYDSHPADANITIRDNTIRGTHPTYGSSSGLVTIRCMAETEAYGTAGKTGRETEEYGYDPTVVAARYKDKIIKISGNRFENGGDVNPVFVLFARANETTVTVENNAFVRTSIIEHNTGVRITNASRVSVTDNLMLHEGLMVSAHTTEGIDSSKYWTIEGNQITGTKGLSLGLSGRVKTAPLFVRAARNIVRETGSQGISGINLFWLEIIDGIYTDNFQDYSGDTSASQANIYINNCKYVRIFGVTIGSINPPEVYRDITVASTDSDTEIMVDDIRTVGTASPIFLAPTGKVVTGGVGGRTSKYSSGAPATTDGYDNGSIAWNAAPASNGYVGWIKTSAGWKGFGLIES